MGTKDDFQCLRNRFRKSRTSFLKSAFKSAHCSCFQFRSVVGNAQRCFLNMKNRTGGCLSSSLTHCVDHGGADAAESSSAMARSAQNGGEKNGIEQGIVRQKRGSMSRSNEEMVNNVAATLGSQLMRSCSTLSCGCRMWCCATLVRSFFRIGTFSDQTASVVASGPPRVTPSEVAQCREV